jgi:hypothetical protein
MNVAVLRVLESLPLIFALDRLARHVVNELLAKSIAGLLIDLPEGNALASGCRRIEGDGARDEREL